MKLGFCQKNGMKLGFWKKMRWNWDFGHEKLDRVWKRLKIVMMFSNKTVYYSNNRIFRDKNYIAHTQLGKKLKKMIGNAHRASHDLDTNWNAHPRSYHPPKYQIDPGICCWTILSNRETVRICRVKLQNRDGNYIQGSKVPCPWIFHVYCLPHPGPKSHLSWGVWTHPANPPFPPRFRADWCAWHPWLPSGKHTKNDGKSPFSMGKSTINGHVQQLC